MKVPGSRGTSKSMHLQMQGVEQMLSCTACGGSMVSQWGQDWPRDSKQYSANEVAANSFSNRIIRSGLRLAADPPRLRES